jgi:aspartate oxidase
LYLYVNLEAAESQPTLKAFVDSVLSDAGLAAAATTGGISLDRTDTDTVRQHWQDALATGKGDAT